MTAATTAIAGEKSLAFAARPGKILIGDQWVEAAGGRTFPVYNPATAEVLTRVAAGEKEDVDRAVKAARASLRDGWGLLGGADRAKLLWRLGDLVEENSAELAQLEALDNGMPVGVATAFSMIAADVLRYMSGWATKLEGSSLALNVPYTPGAEYHAYTRREPFGVVGAIIPWNYPLTVSAWKLGPALAAGNAVVLKPAEQALLSVLRLGELALEAGFPPGAVNIVPGFGEHAGAAIAAHPDIDKITFTGSNEVGKLVLRAAADTNLKKVSMELGGKSPNIIFADADLDGAVAGAANGVFFNQGQNCAAGSRLYVERSVFDEVLDAMAKAAEGVNVGPGLDPTTDMGPLVSAEQRDKVLGYVESGIRGGARAVAGGHALNGDRYGQGYFVKPTVLVDTKPNMDVVTREVFGPVVVAIPFDGADEIVSLANDTHFGLAAGVWTRDVSRAHQIAAQLDAGTVWVNSYNVFDSAMPFGGFKQSGWGRELGHESVLEYTQTKSVCVNL